MVVYSAASSAARSVASTDETTADMMDACSVAQWAGGLAASWAASSAVMLVDKKEPSMAAHLAAG